LQRKKLIPPPRPGGGLLKITIIQRNWYIRGVSQRSCRWFSILFSLDHQSRGKMTRIDAKKHIDSPLQELGEASWRLL